MKPELVLTYVIAVSTAFYTIISLFLLGESKKTRKLKSSPFIIAYLKSTENHTVLALHLKNIGEGLAKNVRIQILKDYKRLGKDHLLLSAVGIVKNGFNIFPPQYDLNFYIQDMLELDADDENCSVELEISYEDVYRKKYKNKYTLPFNQLTGQNYSKPPETFIGQIPYYLKEINQNLSVLRENDEKRTALLQDDSDGPEQETKSPTI